MFIENTTPYVGKIKLSFVKSPYRNIDGPYSVLNKIHLDLGFTKLVSRVFPDALENGYPKLDSEKVKIILQKTKGKIGIHEWWQCTSKNTGYNKKKYSEPNPDIWEVIDHHILEESFVSQKEEFIGDVQDAWWYVQNNLEVCEEFPYGVAKEVGEFGQTTGYYGYTHRGGAVFEKGDRIFDKNYKPKKEDYPNWQWAGWVRDMKNDDGEYLLKNEKKEMRDFIPLNMLGQVPIDTWDEAKEAARNLSKYL